MRLKGFASSWLAVLTIVATAAAATPRPIEAAAAQDRDATTVDQRISVPGRGESIGLDARTVRAELMTILGRYPPSLARVLRLDPTLLTNPSYLASYPALAGFLAQHPEVARSADYFLQTVPAAAVEVPEPRGAAERVWSQTVDGLTTVLVVATVLSITAWVIRTLLDYRRWQRLTRVQADAHTKLLDRFTANEELLAYVQSPAGSQFLQSAPVMLEGTTRRVGAPVGRILWSVQAGLVLGAIGFGFRYLSTRVVDPAVQQPFMGLGVLGLSVGVAFILSAAFAYVLSTRLGLFEPAPGLLVRPPASGADRRPPAGA